MELLVGLLGIGIAAFLGFVLMLLFAPLLMLLAGIVVCLFGGWIPGLIMIAFAWVRMVR